MIELNCETDFVAKSADFQELADQILQVALDQKPADLEALKKAALGEGTVDEAVHALSARIGEKLELKRYVTIDGPVALYLHRRSTDLPPAIGVLVAYDGDDADAARGVAMHIAAARPRYTTRDEVPAEVLENERRDRRGDRARGGQARAGAGPDRRGPGQRLLQGRRAARAASVPGPEEDRQGPARRGRR